MLRVIYCRLCSTAVVVRSALLNDSPIRLYVVRLLFIHLSLYSIMYSVRAFLSAAQMLNDTSTSVLTAHTTV